MIMSKLCKTNEEVDRFIEQMDGQYILSSWTVTVTGRESILVVCQVVEYTSA